MPPSLSGCDYERTGIGPTFPWKVALDNSSPAGYALSCEFGGSGIGPDLFLALPAQFSPFKDGDVRVTLRFNDKAAGIAGVLARYRDAHNYYAAAVDIGRNELALIRVENDRMNVLATAPLEAPGKWTPLSLSIHGDSLRASSGRAAAQAVDKTWNNEGRTGLLTDAVSRVDFTDVQARPATKRK
jgi:hypothetical protein